VRPLAARISNLAAGLLAVTLLAAACASPTPYAPRESGEGYSEQQLERNRYRVSFAGNSITPRETVETYLLYRAAEITLESGHDYFRIVDRDTEKSTVYWNTGSLAYDRRFARYGGYGGLHGGVTTSRSYPNSSYEAIATILVFSGEPPADDDNAYDARDLSRRLGPGILRPRAAGAG